MCRVVISEHDVDTIVSYLQKGGRMFAYFPETGIFHIGGVEQLTEEPEFIIEVEPTSGGLLKKES